MLLPAWRVILIYVTQRRHILYLPSYLNLMPNANVSGKRKINVFACFGDATVDMSWVSDCQTCIGLASNVNFPSKFGPTNPPTRFDLAWLVSYCIAVVKCPGECYVQGLVSNAIYSLAFLWPVFLHASGPLLDSRCIRFLLLWTVSELSLQSEPIPVWKDALSSNHMEQNTLSYYSECRTRHSPL